MPHGSAYETISCVAAGAGQLCCCLHGPLLLLHALQLYLYDALALPSLHCKNRCACLHQTRQSPFALCKTLTGMHVLADVWAAIPATEVLQGVPAAAHH